MSIIYELTMGLVMLSLLIGVFVLMFRGLDQPDYDPLKEYDLMMQREKHNQEMANRALERELAKQQRKQARMKDKPLQS